MTMLNIFAFMRGLFGAGKAARRGPTEANLRAEAVVKLRRANWPHLSQEAPVSHAHYLPLLRKGGGQREVGT